MKIIHSFFCVTALSCLCTTVHAQSVTGTIVDPADNPIAEAWVNIQGEQISVQSDDEGHFSISGEADQTFTFSALGYHTLELTPADLKGHKIILIPTDTDIEIIDVDPADDQPLYVVDGEVVGDIQFLTPDRIESINVHKNNAVTSFYGKKGENGVLYIRLKETKK